MAHPIAFKPQPTDPHQELMRRVDEAPREHAEALLVAWDLLQTAHDKGLLDLAHGLIGGRDVIAKNLAEAMKMPESIDGLRNAIALSRVLASIDPGMLQRLAKSLNEGAKFHKQETEPPSLWRLFKRVASRDGRRGLSFATTMLLSLGRATKG